MKIRAATFLFVGLLAAGMLHAAPVTLPRTEVLTLNSKTNGVDYKLYVSYPRGFEESDAEYPLIVSLDADYSFAIIRNVVEHLSDRHDIPPMVVVSVAYGGETTMTSYRMNRSRDYTPVFDKDDGYGTAFQESSGGAPKLLAFMRDELVPLMQEKYRATGKRALVGHSYGGLFTAWAMLQEPQLFDGYISVSPSLWYHDHWTFLREKEYAESHKALPATAYFAVGDWEVNGSHDMVSDLRNYAMQLRSRGYDRLVLRHDLLKDETHNSIFPRAVSNGIRLVWPRETARAWANSSQGRQ